MGHYESNQTQQNKSKTKELSSKMYSLEVKFKESVDDMRKDLNAEMIDMRKEIQKTKMR